MGSTTAARQRLRWICRPSSSSLSLPWAAAAESPAEGGSGAAPPPAGQEPPEGVEEAQEGATGWT